MKKKVTIVIDGENSLISSLLAEHIKSLDLQQSGNFKINYVMGLSNYKIRTYCNILLMPSLNELKFLEKLKFLKTNQFDLKILLISNFKEADFLCSLFGKGIAAHISFDDDPWEINRAIDSITKNTVFRSTKTDSIISDYYTYKQQKRVAQSDVLLTRMEKVVLRYLCNGLSSPEIAECIFKSTKTINTHRQNIYNKLGIHSISELIIWSNKNTLDF